jgi:hypothetical protein
MSKMSNFYVGIIEMVEQGFNYDSIEQMMVDEGYPREACRPIINQIAGDIDKLERINEIAAESYYHGA